jgi:hypothetical protein
LGHVTRSTTNGKGQIPNKSNVEDKIKKKKINHSKRSKKTLIKRMEVKIK